MLGSKRKLFTFRLYFLAVRITKPQQLATSYAKVTAIISPFTSLANAVLEISIVAVCISGYYFINLLR